MVAVVTVSGNVGGSVGGHGGVALELVTAEMIMWFRWFVSVDLRQPCKSLFFSLSLRTVSNYSPHDPFSRATIVHPSFPCPVPGEVDLCGPRLLSSPADSLYLELGQWEVVARD